MIKRIGILAAMMALFSAYLVTENEQQEPVCWQECGEYNE